MYIFSDNIQEFNNSMKPLDEVVIITSKSVFFLNKKFSFLKRIEVSRIESIVLIKTNPSIFILNVLGSK